MTPPRPAPYNRYPTDAASVAAGYRHLADLIESGAAPVPVGPAVDLFLRSHDPAEQPAAARDLMRALGGGRYDKDESGSSLLLDGMCGGLPVRIWVQRDAVCERVQVGEKTVEYEAQPAREAMPARTETVPVYEWKCAPLLDAASA